MYLYNLTLFTNVGIHLIFCFYYSLTLGIELELETNNLTIVTIYILISIKLIFILKYTFVLKKNMFLGYRIQLLLSTLSILTNKLYSVLAIAIRDYCFSFS